MKSDDVNFVNYNKIITRWELDIFKINHRYKENSNLQILGDFIL